MKNLIKKLTGTHDSILLERATMVAERIGNAQRSLLITLRTKRANLQHELATLSDLAPTQTTQLSVAHREFNPGAFANRVHELKVQLKDVNEELAIAEATMAEWGGDPNETNETEVPVING